MQNGRTFRVSVDIGGTFTDIVLIGSEGSVQTKKVSSTPDNYGRGIVPTPVFYGDNDTLVEIDKKAARAARLALPGVGAVSSRGGKLRSMPLRCYTF